MDLLSNLPDEVLCHILSFLSTKEAAFTSVLSKRWRDLLAFVPYLDIDDSEFLHPEEGKREKEGILESFMDFVDRVLALQGNSPIEKFFLKCKTGVDSDHVDRWIRRVLHRGVSVLSLSIDFGDENELLPPEVFVSKTLVGLKVKRGFDLDWWALGISLPTLKNLFLGSVGFCIDQFEMLLPACPVLETLDLDNFEWMNSNVNVSSASLKEIFIHSNGCVDLINPVSVSFDTPSLVYLWYSDFVAMDYPKVNLTNLVDVRIDLKLTEHHIEQARAQEEDDEDVVFLHLRNVWKLISGISNVQKLYLAANTLEVLSLCCESMPVFKNLKFLNIRSEEGRGWQAMPVLLKKCPHLETLVLEGLLHFVTDKCGDACDCISRKDKGRSLASCPVKKLQIKGFRGTMREIGMIKHFLECFPCLKEMEIYAEENEPTDLEVPQVFELIVRMLILFNKFYACDVQFFVRGSLYKKCTTTQ